MAAKKKMSVTVVSAWIGAIAVVVAAIIGIYPNLVETGAGVQPVKFVKYDDPIGNFSIEYPSNFYLESRELTPTNARLSISEKEVDKYFTIIEIYFEKFSNPNIDLQSEMDNMVVNIINSNGLNKDVFTTTLMSNKTTSKGFYLHYKFDCVPCSDDHLNYFALIESQDNIFASVTVRVFTDISDYEKRDIIDHIIESFYWSSGDVEKLFN